jgi:hypothetical protein
MFKPLRIVWRCGAVAALAAAPTLVGCTSADTGGASGPSARATVAPEWDQTGSPTWTANQGRAPTPTGVPQYTESPYAFTGEGTSGTTGRPDAADAWRQSNPRFGVGNAVILFPPPR